MQVVGLVVQYDQQKHEQRKVIVEKNSKSRCVAVLVLTHERNCCGFTGIKCSLLKCGETYTAGGPFIHIRATSFGSAVC